MATQPDPGTDVIAPQSPQEAPGVGSPAEAPNPDVPGISPPDPGYNEPGTAPSETPPPGE